mmetsp:Transcript_357/g.814  ORF Transcript_357/g.814 Transcript_357/m.814 type:complete len:278 (+) Transcript_357:4371-5204(+)
MAAITAPGVMPRVGLRYEDKGSATGVSTSRTSPRALPVRASRSVSTYSKRWRWNTVHSMVRTPPMAEASGISRDLMATISALPWCGMGTNMRRLPVSTSEDSLYIMYARNLTDQCCANPSRAWLTASAAIAATAQNSGSQRAGRLGGVSYVGLKESAPVQLPPVALVPLAWQNPSAEVPLRPLTPDSFPMPAAAATAAAPDTSGASSSASRSPHGSLSSSVAIAAAAPFLDVAAPLPPHSSTTAGLAALRPALSASGSYPLSLWCAKAVAYGVPAVS